MGEVETPKKSKPNIFKKEIKLGWFFKFLLISGSIFSIVLLGGIIWVNISNNRNESLKLQKEINELKYGSGKLQTSPSQVQQQVVQPSPVIVQDNNPIIDCKSDKCGTKRVTQSECALATCCQIGGDWVWSVNETECRKAQSIVAENNRKAEEAKREENIRNYEAEVSMQNAEAKTDCYKSAGDSYESCSDICDDYSTNLNFIIECRDECMVRYENAKDSCDNFYDL